MTGRILLKFDGILTVNSANPFHGPGTPLAKLGRRSDTRIKLLVAAVVVATVFLFSGLFIQGCQRQPATNAANGDTPGTATTPDSSGTAMADRTVGTNAVTAPSVDTTTTNATASSALPSDTGTGAAPVATKDYLVVKGDSLYKIAKANHITSKALTDANPGVDAKLKIGQTLHVPVATESAATATAPASTTAPSATASSATTAKATETGGIKYVVKSGDTLGRIAKAHGTTVKAIKVANGLTNDRIPVGKTLKLPQGKASTVSSA